MQRIERDCVIAGGGPAGIMLGLLLARAGLTVTVLEKHADFLRDFRGDTIHPSTITLLREIGLKEAFLDLPVSVVHTLDIVLDRRRTTLVDFGTLPKPDNFLVFAPQWDFLSFLVREASKLDGFDLRMSTEATGLVTENDRVVGVTARGTDVAYELRAPLTVACDGRTSVLRESSGLEAEELGVPIDVLWFALPKPEPTPPTTLGYMTGSGAVVTLERSGGYQGGMIIPKGGFDALHKRGLEAFRTAVTSIAPVLDTVITSIDSWDQVKLLTVQLNRLPRWYRPGFICIGDAAHAMSPVMGVGINYALQDAVALANAVVEPLRHGTVPISVLEAVQSRRLPPVKKMQRIQKLAHDRMSRPFAGAHAVPAPARAALRLLQPIVRRVVARVVGLGFLPEHIALREKK